MLVLLVLVVIISSTVMAVKTFRVQETDFVKVNAEAIDPDEDTIKYYYSQPLDDQGEWQTTYGDAGEYSISITASDGIVQTKEGIILTVDEKNRPPYFTNTEVVIKEDQIIDLKKLIVDPDGNYLSYVFSAPFGNDGIWKTTYQDAGSYLIKVSVSDGKLNVTGKIKVIVENVDRMIRLNLPEKLEIKEGEEFSWVIDTYDLDNDSITVNFVFAFEDYVFNQETKTFSWTPSYDLIKRKGGLLSNLLNSFRLENLILKSKTELLTITSCSKGRCVTKSVPVTIYNTNRKPVFEELVNLTITETEEFKLIPQAIDPDGDIVRISFSKLLGKTNGLIKPNIDGEGVYTLYVAATDGTVTETIPVRVEVLNKNRQPSLKIKKDNFVVNEGKEFSFKVITSDPDFDELSVWINDLPEGAFFKDGIFTWTPNFNTAKSIVKSWKEDLLSKSDNLNKVFNNEKEIVWLSFVASDGEFEVVHPVKVTVKNVNQEPEIITFLPSETVTVTVGEPVIFHLTASDEDETALDYEWDFGFREKKIVGTDTLERTFVTSGKKKVKVTVSDGLKKVEKEWVVNVLKEDFFPKTEMEEFIHAQDEATFKTYVIKG